MFIVSEDRRAGRFRLTSALGVDVTVAVTHRSTPAGTPVGSVHVVILGTLLPSEARLLGRRLVEAGLVAEHADAERPIAGPPDEIG